VATKKRNKENARETMFPRNFIKKTGENTIFGVASPFLTLK
jgi:hypothetical protein